MAQDKKWQVLAQRVLAYGRKPQGKRSIPLEQLRQLFEEFVNYYVEHPVSLTQRTRQKQKTSKGKSAKEADVELYGDRVDRAAPMTEYAFCAWIGKSASWFPQTIADLKAKTDPSDDDKEYLAFMLRMQTFFRAQLLEGAIIGEYTPNVVASILGLKNAIDVTSDGKATAAPVINILEDKKTREDYAKKGKV